MKLKDAKESAIAYLEIQQLDVDLKEINEMLENLAYSDGKASIKISVKKSTRDEKPNVLDEDGNIKPKYLDDVRPPTTQSMLYWSPKVTCSSKNEDKIVMRKKLPDYIVIEMMAVLLSHKKAERASLIKRVRQLG